MRNEDINKYIFFEATRDENLFNLKLTSGILWSKKYYKNIFYIKFCQKISLNEQTTLKLKRSLKENFFLAQHGKR